MPRYQEKILPVQPKLCNLYKGAKSKLIDHIYDAILDCSGIENPLKEYKLTISKKIPMEEMGSNPIMLRMLEFLVLLKKPKKVLEIGTYIGLSGMSLAKYLPKGGKVVTIEKFSPIAKLARTNFSKNGFKNKITLIEGDAFKKFNEVKKHGKFDLVFIDGNKERYWDYFLMAEPLLAPGALVIIDDILFHGDAINKVPKTEKGAGARRAMTNGKLAKKYLKLILPLANGYMMFVKK